MASQRETVQVQIEEFEKLLGKRILPDGELHHFWCMMRRLWEGHQDLPKDYQEKFFALEQYFLYYIVNSPNSYRPTKEEALKRLEELIPYQKGDARAAD